MRDEKDQQDKIRINNLNTVDLEKQTVFQIKLKEKQK
jgi:hypothetical protein